MNQFFAARDQINETHIRLEGQEAKHAAKVLRKSLGETIIVTNGKGTRYSGDIESISKNCVNIAIRKSIKFQTPDPSVVLALGLIKKKDRLEFAVEKAAELGVSEIILFRGDHSESFNVRMDRVEAALLSAMKQSLRVYLPSVRAADSLDSIILEKNMNTLIIHADQEGNSIMNMQLPDGIKRILLVVGPEGGFSEREINQLKQKGAIGLKLGDYRLRTETAAVVMASRFGHLKEIRI